MDPEGWGNPAATQLPVGPEGWRYPAAPQLPVGSEGWGYQLLLSYLWVQKKAGETQLPLSYL